MEAARRTIFILGWDLDSRTVLRPDASDPGERTLLPLLCRCLDRQPSLQVFVLVWNFSIIYSFEREPRPRRQFGRAHPRLHFSLDADHGSGGSHHQKVVVVDDQVAFVGGVDLTLHRWDGPQHLPVDPRRIDGDGVLYDPFHDVHAAVAGPAARALGELARTRWRARKRRPAPPPIGPRPTAATDELAGWPADLAIDARDVQVGLARTLSCPGQPAVREIEALTLRAIAAAERWIYAENQYLTSGSVMRALAARLTAARGPEIVLVLPAAESGWKEQSSMGILRAGVLAQLRAADRHQRLRLLTPVVARDGQRRAVAVHAKVLVVDDALAKVGSANFSNRSMGLDSECDLAVEAHDDASAAWVRSVRDRLLGEHLGLLPAEIGARLAGAGSLLRLCDGHPASSPRALVPVPVAVDAPFDFAVLDGAMVDPPEPWSADLLLERAVPVPFRRRVARRWLRPALLAAAVLLVWALLHRWDPHGLRFHLAVKHLTRRIADAPAGPLIAVACYAAAASLFVPVTLLATATLAVFGMWPGVAVAWVGGVLSATLSHAVGARLGDRALRWLPRRLGDGLRRILTRQAFWSVVLMRLLPLGNFAALNLVAGAVKVPRRSFVWGNLAGLLPGLLGLGVVVDRLLALLRRPTVLNVGVASALLALVIGAGAILKRRLTRPPRAPPPAPARAGATGAVAGRQA
jgi:phosphatidylserine/phosphatidylglycerophosphate/cardiolipin synthase-like enzyme/membrane protein DedA with SNARE-associated domain